MSSASPHNPYPLIDRSGVDEDLVLPTPDCSADLYPVPQWSRVSEEEEGHSATTPPRSHQGLPRPAAAGAAGLPDVRQFKKRAGFIIGCLVLVNVLALGTLFAAATPRFGFPSLVSPGLLAYTFGLRHAVDADHIAAIDNVSRSLLESGKVSMLVGLWFSLGHSTVVVLLCVAVAAGSGWIHEHLAAAEGIGAIVGTAVSSTVLLLIGAVNLYTAKKLMRQWRGVRGSRRANTGSINGETAPLLGPKNDAGMHAHYGEAEHTHLVTITENAEVESVGGLFAKCCPVVMRAVDAPWKMYPIGFLFGLGFDTATEVALLAICAMGPKEKIPGYLVLLLPGLFAAGMSLIDTLDGIMMMYAYGWALVDPAQKIFFNLYLTLVSAAIAIIVSVVEVLGCVQSEVTKPKLGGPFWDTVGAINDNFEYVGYSIIGFFVLSMLTAWILYRSLFGKGGSATPASPPQPAAKRALQYPIVDRSGI